MVGVEEEEEKKLKLFGFEVHLREKGTDSNSEKSTASLSSDDRVEVKEEKKFVCQFCFKEFPNSQALGGHQNAHKNERMKRRKLEMQARKAGLACYLQPFIHSHEGDWKYHVPWLYESGGTRLSTAGFTLLEEFNGSLRPLGQNNNLGGLASSKPSISQESKSLDLQLGLGAKPAAAGSCKQ